MKNQRRTALVTGSARGIGKAIARRLSSEGMNVAICDVQSELGEKTRDELRRHGCDAIFIACDVADGKMVSEMIKKVESHFGRLDVLVNNAGITTDRLLLRMSDEDWAKVIAVNLTGVFNCTRSAIRGMIARRFGRIVNISSVIGIIGNIGQANYAASKAGIVGFTKSVAKEVAARGITVNAIAPGYIDTPMTESLSEDVKKRLFDLIPMRRLGTVDDVANVVAFLVSDDAAYITGQVIHVNGGMYM